mmetsp:Transcript_15963/g.32783  ORF Transcript_15963/g.32783 Transcript_15963/m.32783 type:complete len:281 (-) Transcript_15963:17-859(-)
MLSSNRRASLRRAWNVRAAGIRFTSRQFSASVTLPPGNPTAVPTSIACVHEVSWLRQPRSGRTATLRLPPTRRPSSVSCSAGTSRGSLGSTRSTSLSLSSSSPYPKENTSDASPLRPSRERFPRRSTRNLMSAAVAFVTSAPVPSLMSRYLSPEGVVLKFPSSLSNIAASRFAPSSRASWMLLARFPPSDRFPKFSGGATPFTSASARSARNARKATPPSAESDALRVRLASPCGCSVHATAERQPGSRERKGARSVENPLTLETRRRVHDSTHKAAGRL